MSSVRKLSWLPSFHASEDTVMSSQPPATFSISLSSNTKESDINKHLPTCSLTTAGTKHTTHRHMTNQTFWEIFLTSFLNDVNAISINKQMHTSGELKNRIANNFFFPTSTLSSIILMRYLRLYIFPLQINNFRKWNFQNMYIILYYCSDVLW